MSNRRRPRLTRDQRIAALASCPDCNSTVRVGPRWSEGNVWTPVVKHDETCPWLAANRDELPVIRVPMHLLDEDGGDDS